MPRIRFGTTDDKKLDTEPSSKSSKFRP